MNLFDGLPVPSTLFYSCARVFRAYMFLYTLNLTHYLECIHEYDVVKVCVSVQTFQDGYNNLLILLFFEKYYSVEYGLTYMYL